MRQLPEHWRQEVRKMIDKSMLAHIKSLAVLVGLITD